MSTIYRGIVVVHGVGEHSKGSYISGFVEQLVNFLSSDAAVGGGNVQLSVRSRGDTSDTSWATIHVKNENPARPDEEWHIREAWWSKTFNASSAGGVYLWAILAGLALIWAAAKHQFLRGILTVCAPTKLARWDSEIVGRPFDRVAHAPLPPSAQGIWLQLTSSRGKAILDGVIWFVFSILWLVFGVLGVLLLGIIYLILVLPLSLVLPGIAKKVIATLVKVIVYQLGDQEAMTTRRFALASAANEVNSALESMLSAKGLEVRHAVDVGFTGFETVTVVAHSGGCVVSMAALKSIDLARIRSEPLASGITRPARLNWVTAGSGLNLAWNVRFGGTPADAALWHGQLDGVNWLNMYARYDPVPQGPPRESMVEALVGNDPETMDEPGAGPRPAYVGLRVVNVDNPWADHGGYWKNHPEAMSRIVHLVTDAGSASTPLNPDIPAAAPKNLAALDGLAGMVAARGASRRTKITVAMLCVWLVMVALVPVTVFWSDDVGRWGLGTDTILGMDPWAPGGRKLENIVTDELAKVNIERYRDRIAGLAIIAITGMVAIEYLRLAKWLLEYGANQQRRRDAIIWVSGASVVLLATLGLLDLLLIRWPTGVVG